VAVLNESLDRRHPFRRFNVLQQLHLRASQDVGAGGPLPRIRESPLQAGSPKLTATPHRRQRAEVCDELLIIERQALERNSRSVIGGQSRTEPTLSPESRLRGFIV
jgi:hypothetical protein